MEAFEKNYEKFAKTCDLSLIREDYEELLANMDQPVRVIAGENSFEGIARGITDIGVLIVERQDGTYTTVNAGEVSVRGLYSYV